MQGENPAAEAISACSTPQNVTLGERAQIRFTLTGDLRTNTIVVYKRDSPSALVKVADCFFRAGERLCETRPGFNFNLTSDKEQTLGDLIIERVTEDYAGEYICQTLNPPKLFLPCVLQGSKEKPEVNTQMVFREGGHSTEKKIDAAKNQTGTDRNSTFPTGAIAGIVVGTVVALIVVAVAAVVVMKYKRTCCKAAYIPTTLEGGVTSNDKRDQSPCISPTTEGGNTSSASSLEPLMKDNVNV